MLKAQLDFYIAHQDEFVAKYLGKFLVIKDNELIGIFDSLKDAYFDSMGKYSPGTFMIIECKPGEDSYTQRFHSRVIFS